MIVVRVELHSAVTGQVTELGRAIISNSGGTEKRGESLAEHQYDCPGSKRGPR
jgi:hypothetical protein